MIGKVIEGRFAGAGIHRLPEKNMLYIETESGERIPLSKKNALSVTDASEKYPANGCRFLCVTWNDQETSVIQLGSPAEAAPEEAPAPAEEIVPAENTAAVEAAEPVAEEVASVETVASAEEVTAEDTVPEEADPVEEAVQEDVRSPKADARKKVSLIDKIKANKKWAALICAAVVVVLIVVAALFSQRVSGSYYGIFSNGYGVRYEFTIKKDAIGEYGGECKEYYSGELIGTYAWYVEKKVIYINGYEQFRYDSRYDRIYEPESVCKIILNEDMTCKENRGPYQSDKGTYKIVDGILYVLWDGRLYEDTFAVVDGVFYEWFGDRV